MEQDGINSITSPSLGNSISRPTSPPTTNATIFPRGSVGSLAMEETRLEKEMMQKEKLWAISNEMPFVCKEIQRLLQECTEALVISHDSKASKLSTSREDAKTIEDSSATSSATNSSQSSKPVPSQLMSFETSEGVLKGYIRIEGCNVMESELTVKSPKWNKNTPFKTCINTVNPLQLNQLINAFNFMKLACASLQEINLLVSAPSKEDKVKLILKVVEEASCNLKNAMEELLLAPANLFPKTTLMNYQPSLVFQPSPPSDMVVELNIQNNQVVITIYFLHKLGVGVQQTGTAMPPITPQQTPTLFSKDSIIGQRFQLSSNNIVEVVDFVQVHCVSNVVKSTSAAISLAYQLCAELHDKLVLFLGL